MASEYYKPCKELEECGRLIEEYFKTGQYEACFRGHLRLAEKGYPLAECQVGYFYREGLGVERDWERSLYWTRRAAEHGDRDAQCNLADFYLEGVAVERDPAAAREWLVKSARQGNACAQKQCAQLDIHFETAEKD